MHTPETRERAYAKNRKLRKDWFDANGPCPCGSWENLELHHVDPSTKVDHKVWTWNAVRREAELKKCKVLCHICHRELHAKERWAGHGHIGTYRKGCRCSPCKEVKSIENKKRKR